ncbi:MAG: recombinase family protein [Blastocatellia bacterium]|nr:recombinase family protein [Blastocatellia bacterium]
MKIGYARVSTHDQNLDLQRDALKQAGCEKTYVDQASGKTMERTGLERALDHLRPGDTLVVWRLDRLGRSLKHLIELMSDLEQKGISFCSLQESINTASPGGKLVFHLFGALAEFERNLIRERTQAGLVAARARGRNGGRPRALTRKQEELALKLYQERQHSIREICGLLKISKPTLYEYLHRLQAVPTSRQPS